MATGNAFLAAHTEGVQRIMSITKLRMTAALAALAAIAGGLLAPTPKMESAIAAEEAKAKAAQSAEMAKTEAKLAKLQEIIRPQAGEHVANMAKIAWQRDAWEAAVKAGKEGK